MKIFIDFDDVLFNMKRFKRDLVTVFRRNGITRQEFDNSYYAFSKGAHIGGKLYDPKKQIKVLKRRFEIDQKKLEKDLDKLIDDLGGYVFSDVHDFLSCFRKKDLFMISYGHEQFQKKKIKNSGLSKYFHKIIINKDRKMNIVMDICKKYHFSPDKEDIILIDDRPEQIERAEGESKRIRTFRLCRREGRYSDLLCIDKDWEVKNLREISRIIKKEKMK